MKTNSIVWLGVLGCTLCILLAGSGCGPSRSTLPRGCARGGSVDWACVESAYRAAPDRLERSPSPGNVQSAIAYYIACLETGNVRAGREGLEWILAEKLQQRGRFPRAAQIGGLLLLASYLEDMRSLEAFQLAERLEEMYSNCVSPDARDAELYAMLQVGSAQIPIAAVRKLYRDGLPPLRSSDSLADPILPQMSRSTGGGRLLVARLRLYGAGIRPGEWGEIDLFHQCLRYALSRIDETIVLLPYEAEILLERKLGSGETIDDFQVAELLREYAWALGCQSVLVVGGLSDGSRLRVLNAYIYSPETAVEFDGYMPRASRDASAEIDLDDGDLLSGVVELARWTTSMLNPARVDRGGPEINIPSSPREELRDIATMLAAGNGAGAHAACDLLRQRAAVSWQPVDGTYIDFLDQQALQQMQGGSITQFRHRMLDLFIAD